MKVLVTGGAGFIGSHLVDALIERGHNVRILDSLVKQVHAGKPPAHLHPAAEFVRGDVCDAEAVRYCLSGVEAVFHHAAEVGVGQSMYEPERYMRANTMGTTMLLEGIRERKTSIKKLVVASSMSIYGEGEYQCVQCGTSAPDMRKLEELRTGRWDVGCTQCGGELIPMPTRESKALFPASVYAVSKQDQEQLSLIMGRAYGVPTVALRYFNVYGTRQALSNPYTGVCAIFCSRLLNEQSPVIYEDGKQTRDFVHVSDVVQANLLALGSTGADFEAVNVGSGQAISICEVAETLAKTMGKNISAKTTGQYRVGDIRHCVADIGKAKSHLGYQPKVQLHDGMRELVAWVKSQTAEDRGQQAAQELEENQLLHSAAPAA